MTMTEVNSKIKHVLGLSGGKDSAALAVHMAENYPELELDYFLLIPVQSFQRLRLI